MRHIWDKVFKNGPSKICGKQPFERLSYTNFTWSILEYFVPYCFMHIRDAIKRKSAKMKDKELPYQNCGSFTNVT